MFDLQRAANALAGAAAILVTFKARPQGVEGYVAEYDNLLTALIRKTWRGELTAGAMATEHRAILRNLAPGCYYEGMAQGGVEQADADEQDRQVIADWIAEQASHTRDLAKAAHDAGSDKAAREAVKARSDLWLAAMLALGHLGRASAQANAVGWWRYDGGEHCETCAKLDGQKHRLKWYVNHNYIPRQPGAAMQCGGYRCKCSVVDKRGNRIL